MPKRQRNSESSTPSLGNHFVPDYLLQLAEQNQLDTFKQILANSIQGIREFQFLVRHSQKLLESLLTQSKFNFVDVYIECLEQQAALLPPAQRKKNPPVHNLIFGVLIKSNEAVATFLTRYPGEVDITLPCDYKYQENTCLRTHNYWLLRDEPCLPLYLQQATPEQLQALFIWTLDDDRRWNSKFGLIVKAITNLNSLIQPLSLKLHCRCIQLLFEQQMAVEFMEAHTSLKAKYPNYQTELSRINIFVNCKSSFNNNNDGFEWIKSINDTLIILEFLLKHDSYLFSDPSLLGKILSSLVLHPESQELFAKFIQKAQEPLGKPLSESQWHSFENNLDWELLLNIEHISPGWGKNVKQLFTLHPHHQPTDSENTVSERIVYNAFKAITKRQYGNFRNKKVSHYIFRIFSEFYGAENVNAAILKYYFPYLLSIEEDSPLELFKAALNSFYHPAVHELSNYAFILPLIKKAFLIKIQYWNSATIGAIDLQASGLRVVLDFFKVTPETLTWDLIDHLVDVAQSGTRSDLTSTIILTKLNELLKISPEPHTETPVFTKIAAFKIQHQNNKETPYRLGPIEQFFLEHPQCRTLMRQALNLATRTNLKKGAQLAGLHEDKQSTHGTGVHKSCAETAKKLWEAYFVKPFAENEREAEVNKAIEELFDFYYKNALESTKRLHIPHARQIYNDGNGWLLQSWESLSEKKKLGYLYIATFFLSAKLGDRYHTLYPRMDNKIYWLDTNFIAHRFLSYCRHHYLTQKESISELTLKQILASLWRAIEDKSALTIDYQQRIKEKLFRDLLCSLAREYNTSIYHTIYLVNSLPGPEILTKHVKFSHAIYITPDGTVFLVANTKTKVLSIPAEVAVSVFTSGQRLTNFNEPVSQQDSLPENIINPFWDSLETLGISRYSADIPTCFGGVVNSSLSLLDGQHPLVFTDQVTTTRIINFIVDFYEPKFQALPSTEKDAFAEYILKEESLPKAFVDRYVDDFYHFMKPHVDRGALTQKDLSCWFAGEELPISLFKEIREYCVKKQNTIESPRQQLSFFQPETEAQANQQTNIHRGPYG